MIATATNRQRRIRRIGQTGIKLPVWHPGSMSMIDAVKNPSAVWLDEATAYSQGYVKYPYPEGPLVWAMKSELDSEILLQNRAQIEAVQSQSDSVQRSVRSLASASYALTATMRALSGDAPGAMLAAGASIAGAIGSVKAYSDVFHGVPVFPILGSISNIYGSLASLGGSDKKGSPDLSELLGRSRQLYEQALDIKNRAIGVLTAIREREGQLDIVVNQAGQTVQLVNQVGLAVETAAQLKMDAEGRAQLLRQSIPMYEANYNEYQVRVLRSQSEASSKRIDIGWYQRAIYVLERDYAAAKSGGPEDSLESVGAITNEILQYSPRLQSYNMVGATPLKWVSLAYSMTSKWTIPDLMLMDINDHKSLLFQAGSRISFLEKAIYSDTIIREEWSIRKRTAENEIASLQGSAAQYAADVANNKSRLEAEKNKLSQLYSQRNTLSSQIAEIDATTYQLRSMSQKAVTDFILFRKGVQNITVRDMDILNQGLMFYMSTAMASAN